jgi:transcriptional regulator with XRE-family HTH domain
VPPAVAVEIEFLRRQRGLSQREIAAKIGRSQGQLASALRGHDPISGAAINRLRDILLGVI